MSQTTEIINTLGSLGLLERLDDETKQAGLLDFQLLINLVRDKRYERVQGIGDDFIPDTDLYNAVGAIYPLLNKEQKNDAIKAHLKLFDGLNYLRTNTNHTPNIRDPQLLTDITIARTVYWPGLHNEEQLWKRKRSFARLQKDIMKENGLFDESKVKSDFLVAYALMRNDLTKFGDDYVKIANPSFLERVVKGIVALFVGEITKEKIKEKNRTKLYKLLPKAIHYRIEPLIEEADWTDSSQFRL